MLSFLIKSAQNLGKDILAIVSRCKGNKKNGNTKLFRFFLLNNRDRVYLIVPSTSSV